MNKIFILSGAVFLCTLGGIAQAASMEGSVTGTTVGEAIPVGESGAVVHIASSYENFDMAEENHPLAGASGPCFGSVMMLGGATSGGGHCAFTDGDGETALVSFEVTGMSEEGALTGDWTTEGGTGKWERAEGQGTFSSLSDPEAGTFTNSLTGEITPGS
ncbi:hypothetical protein [Tranquillimonas alkanivorans]|uniref:Avidin family protein n=1 Tax=Tranquillimonas alkanivorans TaxID=441119 RepID=A0A1I5WDN1_9RHOB|nr:hypothetical protein [Tranquillimonas alkanivorans]SFQ17844.1 hypothetical protein SAMN04488047_14415 [Tranquillimonas alkanivorans]